MSDGTRVRCLTIIVVCALVAAGSMAQGTQPPPPGEQPVAGSSPALVPSPLESVVETPPASPQSSAAFVPLATESVEVQGAQPVLLDMSRVPETPELAQRLGTPRAHIQGTFDQNQPGMAARSSLSAEEHPNPMSVPEEMPSGEAARTPESTRAPGAWVSYFDARGYTGWIPPDTMMAVGPEYIVEPLNSGFVVYTKTGILTRSYTSFSSFVNLPSPWNGFCYDPRVVYDQDSGHFLMMIMGKDTTNLKSYFWLMASQTSNPNGNWYLYRYDATSGSTGSEEWLDYAAIATDNWGIYVTGNSYLFGGGFQKTRVWTLNRGILTGGASNGYYNDDFRWPNNNKAFAIQPAQAQTDNYASKTFFMNNYSGSGTQVCLWTFTGDRYSGQGIGTRSFTRVAIDARTYYAIGNNVDQPGSSYDIDGGDCRIQNVVYSNGKVYTTFGLDWDGSHSYSEVYAAAFNTDAGTKAWDFALWNPAYFMMYPAIAVEGTELNPNWAIIMSMTEPGVSTGWAGVASFIRDPATSTSAFNWSRHGEGTYVRLDDNDRNRWGDYSMSAYDWTCKNVWAAGEFATDSNTWQTQIVARTIDDEPACAYTHVISPNGGETVTAGTTVSVTWSRMNIPSSDDIWVRFWDGSVLHDYGPLAYTATSYSWSVPNTPTSSATITVGSWDPVATEWHAYDSSDGTFTVLGAPDLQPSSLIPASSSIYPGRSMSVYNRVANTGTVAAGSFTVQLRLSTNTICSTSDTLLASRTIGSLAAGALNAASTSITIPSGTSVGTSYLCMLVDPLGTVSEYSEINNSMYVSLTILDPTLFLDGFESGGLSHWSSHVP